MTFGLGADAKQQVASLYYYWR